ncbi:hypothetical protein AB0D97_24820 [Streptomyces roseus]|uniref:hypothetical protein n=1 Tax=Streptomyces roseus TaxID=66430 RepID=UPI0033D5C1FB
MDAIVKNHLLESIRPDDEGEEQDWLPDVRSATGRDGIAELAGWPEAAKKRASRDPLAVPRADSK